MKEKFRQSMAWLHTWTGLLVGWVLFFVFLTGTLGYLAVEIDHWMRPEEPSARAFPPATDLLRNAERTLHDKAPPDVEFWFVELPGRRGNGRLRVGWQERSASGQSAAFTSEALDPHTGLPAGTATPRATGGGGTLYAMHYRLHYMSRDAALRIVGLCSMFMLVAIFSGVVTHKKIFADLFTFRPGKGQRSWLDGHCLLAVSALPFHLMITWSGLIIYGFQYVPAGAATLYPQATDRERAFAEAYAEVRIPSAGDVTPRSAGSLVALSPLLAHAEARVGADEVLYLYIYNPGRENALLALWGGESSPLMNFSAATGEEVTVPYSAPGNFRSAIFALHEGRFAGPVLRVLYVLAGLAGTAMIATGLLLWSAKRMAKVARNGRPHLGMAAVDILNVGTIIGLPIGIAAYFWANRLLPVGMDGRAAWEVHTMFITWSLAYIVAIWRPIDRSWRDLCWLAAAAYGLLPVVNALTTNRHLGASVPAGDWIFAGFDLSALAAGLVFALVARKAGRRAQSHTHGLQTPVEATA